MPWLDPKAAINYRNSVTAVDVLAAPTLGAGSAVSGGSCTAGAYNVKAVGINPCGRTTGQTAVQTTTATTNLTVRQAITALSGATAYDIYCSTDTDPKWVGQIPATGTNSLATGCVITAVGTVGAGGVAGSVDIQVPGTGLQALTSAAINTAYNLPTSIATQGHQYIDFFIALTRTGDAVAPALSVIPFFLDAADGNYNQGDEYVFAFGGASGDSSLRQVLRIECRGNAGIALAVSNIAGTGAAAAIHYSLT